jgi:hypothetical protein
MGKQIQADTRQQTPREQANMLATKWAEQKKKEEEAKDARKRLEEQLHEWAVEHTEEFGDKKTLTLDDAKLVWAARSKVVMPKEVDPGKLLKTFPEHVKVDIPVAKARAIEQDTKLSGKMKELGIELTAEDRFEVKS